ncbi:MAG: hypothetical protein MR894_02660 [Akkermansia muciniphila]|nr:hypothetical protein [Akkermansia muciniphila]
MLYYAAVMLLKSNGTPFPFKWESPEKTCNPQRVNWLLICYCVAYSAIMIDYPVEHIDTSILTYPAIYGQTAVSSELHYSSQIFSWFVFCLQQWFPSLSILSVILLFVNFLAGCIICCLANAKQSNVGRFVGISLLIYLFWYDISCVLYGATSFLGAITAYIYCRKYACRAHILRFIFGMSLFCLAIQIRASAIVGVLPFLFVIVMSDITRRKWGQVGLAALCGILITLSFASSHNFSDCPIWSASSPTQKSSVINEIRSRFCDYNDCSGIDKNKQYREIEVSGNDLNLLTRSCIIHPCRGDSDWFAALSEVRSIGNQTTPTSFALMRERLMSYDQWGYVAFAYTVCLFVGIFAFLYRRQYVVLMILATYVACSLLLILRGRFACAAPPAMMICASVLTFYFIKMPSLRFLHRFRVWGYVFLGGLSVFLLVYNKSFRLRSLFNPIANIEQVCRANPQNVYLTFNSLLWWKKGSRRVSPYAEDYKHTPNLFTLTSWLITMPAYNYEMEKYMKTYPVMDFTAPNVYFIAYGPWELEPICTYLKEHAGKNAHVVKDGSADGFGIYRITEE